MLPWIRHLTSFLRRGRLDDELADEIEQHIEWRRESLIQQGMDPVRAEYEARRQFGNVTRKREESRDMRGFPAMETVMQDIRYATRMLRRSPTFAFVAISSLAIGIGSATAVFNLIDAVLLRKLPVARPDELAILQWESPSTARMPAESLNGNFTRNDTLQWSTSFSLATFDVLRRESPANIRVIGFAGDMSFNVAVGSISEIADGQAVSGNYFDALGLAPAAGRLLTDTDDVASASAVAVISYDLWHSRFGASRDVIGRTISLNALPVTIVGVMPKGFRSTLQVGSAPAITIPLTLRERLERTPSYRSAGSWWVLMMARVPRGVDRAAAQSQLESLFRQSVQANSSQLQPDDLPRLKLFPGARGQQETRDELHEPIRVLVLIATVVLLAACAIVANLLLARGQARIHELTVRLSIGASRIRVVRQLFTEGLLLAVVGSTLGLVVARWIGEAAPLAFGGSFSALHVDLGLDWRLMFFTMSLTAVCTVLFAIVPALRSTDVRLASGLREHSRSTTASRQRRLLARGFVAIQVALSVLLIVAATLLLRSVTNLTSTSLGFDPTSILIFRLDPSRNGYTPAQAQLLNGRVIERLSALPGARSASLLSNTLIGGGMSITLAALPGDPGLEPGTREARAFFDTHAAHVLSVSDRFFETMAIPILQGRALAASDAADAPPVVVINQKLAQRMFGTNDALGKRLRTQLQSNARLFEIVGVCADAKYSSLRREAPPTMYFDYRQRPVTSPTFAVKTAGDPSAVATAVTDVVRQLDADLPVFAVRSQATQIERSLQQERFLARMATLLGAVTLLLCGIGLFGLLAYDVTRRTSEIGVRLALGAERRVVAWMVLRQSLLMAAAGLAFGIPVALVAARVLRRLLFGVTPADPWSFLVATLVMLLIAAIAAYLPARRASRVDPVVALRAE
jgi:predicted permease